MLARWLGDVFADRVARGTWILLFLLVGLVGTLFMHRAQVFTGFDLVPGRMGDTRLLIFFSTTGPKCSPGGAVDLANHDVSDGRHLGLFRYGVWPGVACRPARGWAGSV